MNREASVAGGAKIVLLCIKRYAVSAEKIVKFLFDPLEIDQFSAAIVLEKEVTILKTVQTEAPDEREETGISVIEILDHPSMLITALLQTTKQSWSK